MPKREYTRQELSSQASWRIEITAGLLSRGAIRRAIKSLAFEYSLELDLQEDKGWLESLFLLSVRGPGYDVLSFQNRLLGFLDEINEEESSDE